MSNYGYNSPSQPSSVPAPSSTPTPAPSSTPTPAPTPAPISTPTTNPASGEGYSSPVVPSSSIKSTQDINLRQYDDGELYHPNLPPTYVSANLGGIPIGQQCSNCSFYNVPLGGTGAVGQCSKWNANVRANNWCASWNAIQVGSTSRNTIQAEPYAVSGYYPLYTTPENARAASPTPDTAREGETTLGYHLHTLNGVKHYMPNGLDGIGQQFHGDYQEITPPTPESTPIASTYITEFKMKNQKGNNIIYPRGSIVFYKGELYQVVKKVHGRLPKDGDYYSRLTPNNVTTYNGETGDVQGVSSFNGLTGSVHGVSSFNGSTGTVQGVSSFNGSTGTVQGVSSVNGVTGAVTNIATTNTTNTFAERQTFAKGISINAGGITFGDGTHQTTAAASAVVAGAGITINGSTLGIDSTAVIHVAGMSSNGGITIGGNLQIADNNFDMVNADGNKVFDLTTRNVKIGDCDGAGNSTTILIRDSHNVITQTATTSITLNTDNVPINSKLSHNGDSNTHLNFPAADTITLTAGGVTLANLTTTGFAFPQGISLEGGGVTFADGTQTTTALRTDSYTGQIETAADKTYTLDPKVATARTITGFYIKSASGTVTATLKNGSDTVKAASVSSSSGDQTSLANTSVAADAVLTLVLSSNSSALDVIFNVEYTSAL